MQTPHPGFARPSIASGDSLDGDALATAIGLAPRRLGKADLALPTADRARATALRPDLDPGEWSVDQAARIAFMAASYAGDDAAFAASFDDFCATAEINELIALLPGTAGLSRRRIARAARKGGGALRHEAGIRGRRPSQSLSCRMFRRRRLESDGGEGLFHRLDICWPIQRLDRRGNPAARPHAGRPRAGEMGGRAAGERRSVALRGAACRRARDVAALVRAFETGSDKERLAVALALKQTGPQAGPTPCASEPASAGSKSGEMQARLAAEELGWEALGVRTMLTISTDIRKQDK